MKRVIAFGAAAAALAALLAVGASTLATARNTPKTPSGRQVAAVGCALGGSGQASHIQHVIYLQFDNTHYLRDASNAASDLEQMPHLLDFLKTNGTLFTNDHTILISHTAGGILSSLTGLYPDRQGQTVSNSYDYYRADAKPTFSSSFKYWTDPVASPADTTPNMVNGDSGTPKTTPAPWVSYTRAGCDVGNISVANTVLENTSTSATGGDIYTVFGPGSPEFVEATN